MDTLQLIKSISVPVIASISIELTLEIWAYPQLNSIASMND